MNSHAASGAAAVSCEELSGMGSGALNGSPWPAKRGADRAPTEGRELYRLCKPASNQDNRGMSLITLLDSHLAYGDRPLLDGAQLAVRAGERVGLIGRNGTGKSTLLRVIAGLTQLDAGEIQRRDGLRITCVEQEPELPPGA